MSERTHEYDDHRKVETNSTQINFDIHLYIMHVWFIKGKYEYIVTSILGKYCIINFVGKKLHTILGGITL